LSHKEDESVEITIHRIHQSHIFPSTVVPRLSAHLIKYAPGISAHKIEVFNVFKTEN